jgi:hypothetical protein
MKNKLLLCALLLLFPILSNVMFSQEDDSDDEYTEATHAPSLYESVKNDKGLTGLIRIADKKMVIPFKYNDITLDGTPAIVPLAYVNIYDSLNNEGIYSLADKKVIIPCKYAEIEKEYQDFYPNDGKELYEFCGFEGKSGKDENAITDFYSPGGKKLMSTKYKIYLADFDSKKKLYMGFFLTPQESTISCPYIGYFLYNAKSGTLIQNREYRTLDLGGTNQLIVSNQENKYGIVDIPSGKFIIGMQYDTLYYGIYGTEYIARKGNNTLLFDDNGKISIQPGTYDAMESFHNATYDKENTWALSVSKNGKWGCVDTRNKILIPIIYDAPVEYSDTMWVSKGHKWGAISSKGIEVAPFAYDSILFGKYDNYDIWDTIYFDYYSVQQNGKWGCVRPSGQNILPVEYDRQVKYYDTMWVSKNGKWGCIDKDLKVLVDFKFDTAVYSNFSYGTKGISCTKSKKEIQLTFKGEEIHVKTLLEAVNTKDRTAFMSQIGAANSREKGVALYYAIYNNNMEMFTLLLKNDPELNFVYDSKPPIYHVALLARGYDRDQSSLKMLTSLLNAGADPNQRGFSGDTPLMAYLSSNYGPKIEFVRALLRAGAKVNLKNDYGDDVYDKLSSSSASDDIKDLLKQSE